MPEQYADVDLDQVIAAVERLARGENRE